MDINYFLKINNASGTTSKKDTQLYNLKSQVNDKFSDTIDCYNVSVNGVNQDLLIIRTTNHNKKTIKCRPNEDFSVGDIVVWEGSNWLVTSKDAGNQVYTTGTIEECNYTLLFQSPTGTIISTPCITSNKSFSNDESKVMVLGSNQKSISCAFNADTELLDTDDRLFVDKATNKTPYKIIGDVDTTTNDGLIYFIVEQCVTEIDDRPDLGICNYREPIVTPPTNPVNISISCTSSTSFTNNIKLGLTYTFKSTITNASGDVISTAIPVFSIDNTYGGLVTLVNNGDGTCGVKATSNSLLTKQVILTCTDTQSGYLSSIELTVAPLY